MVKGPAGEARTEVIIGDDFTNPEARTFFWNAGTKAGRKDM